MIVYDNVYPNVQDTSTVTISVNRNENAPLFIRSFDVTIPETTPLGQIITNVTATDLDGDVLKYSIMNTFNNNGFDLFYINPDTGAISLKRTLINENLSSYQVYLATIDFVRN